MANRTAKEAVTIHGTNPQFLIEKIIRTRIYEARYWKEDCFALSAELLVDRGVDLKYIGGTYGGNIKPSPFLCLVLKMLQIQPEKDIVHEFIRQEDFKYCRALGAFYLRLTGTSLEIYQYLEPLLNDYRKMRKMDRMAQFTVVAMDEFIDDLLREDRMFDVILPRISKRWVHEEAGELEKRISALDDDLKLDDDENDDDIDESDEDVDSSIGSSSGPGSEDGEVGRTRKHYHADDRNRRDRDRDRDRHRRSRSNSPSYHNRRPGNVSRRSRSRSRSRSTRLRHRDDHQDEYESHRQRHEHHRSHDRHDRYDRHEESRDKRGDRSRDKDLDRNSRSHRSERDRRPPKKENTRKHEREAPSGGSERANKPSDGSLSIEETNRIRAELGLKPLK